LRVNWFGSKRGLVEKVPWNFTKFIVG